MAGFEMSGFTPKAREITQMAAECAGAWGHTYVGSEHLLLAMTRLSGCTASQILKKHGVTLKKDRGPSGIHHRARHTLPHDGK